MESSLNSHIRDTDISWLPGSGRCRQPADTWRLVQPALKRFGVTRVAAITGLDRIGIPVYVAVRPNSRSLSVSQGKGLDIDSAMVSAAMEAIELHHAEYIQHPVYLENHRHLRERLSVVDPQSLPLAKHSLFHDNMPVPWIAAHDLFEDRAVMVPLEAVHCNAGIPQIPGNGCFISSSNGLASGNTLAEAVLHGLCEVVERDAHALWQWRQDDERQARRLDLSLVKNPLIRETLEKFQQADMAVMAWCLTCDIPIPVIQVSIYDRQADPAFRPVAVAAGIGCHPSRDVAFLRGLTEAAQSRLTAISGARDDLTREKYRVTRQAHVMERFARLAAQQGCLDFESLPDRVYTAASEAIEGIKGQLAAAGFKQVLVCDLSTLDFPCAVAKVLVPGLEGPVESPQYTPGMRVRTQFS